MFGGRVGDLIDIYMAWKTYKICTEVEGGLPIWLRILMCINILGDFLVGLVPFFGDILDAWWRCNTINVKLLDTHLNNKYGPKDPDAQRLAGLVLLEDDPILGTINPPPYQQRVTEPQRSHPVNTSDGKKFGWFNSGGQKAHVPDLESGQARYQGNNYGEAMKNDIKVSNVKR